MSALGVRRDAQYRLPPGVGAIPTDLSGLAIFSAAGGIGERIEIELIDPFKHVVVRFNGRRMGVGEETVWMAVIRLAQCVQVGGTVRCRESDLLRDCGLADSGQNREILLQRLFRLSESYIQIRASYRKFALACGLMSFRRVDDKLEIWLDPRGAPLFSRGRLAYQKWATRICVSDIGKKLLTVFSGHKKGRVHMIRLDEIGRAIGWEGRRSNLRRAIKEGLKELMDAGALEVGCMHNQDGVHLIAFSR